MFRLKLRVIAAVFLCSYSMLNVSKTTYGQPEVINNFNTSKQFIPAYQNYIEFTDKQGADGLRKIALADFAIRDDYLNKTLRGEQAFTYAKKIYDDFAANTNHTMRFSPVKVTDTYAIIYAEEAITTDESDKNLVSTITWRWKHTWRKTAQGWKLASLARDDRSEAQRKSVAFSLTVAAKQIPSSTKLFAPVFQQYVDGYIGRRGEQGLRPVVTSGFVWYTESDHTELQGDKAIAQAAKYLGFNEPPSQDRSVSTSRSLSISCSTPEFSEDGNSAVLYTSLNYGYLVMEANTGKGSTAIGLYKQTWKKTLQGWRIAAMEFDPRPDTVRMDTSKYITVAKGEEPMRPIKQP